MLHESLKHIVTKEEQYFLRHNLKTKLSNLDPKLLALLSTAIKKDHGLTITQLMLAAIINRNNKETAMIIANLYVALKQAWTKPESIGPAQKGSWLIDAFIIKQIFLCLEKEYEFTIDKFINNSETIHTILILRGYRIYKELLTCNPFIEDDKYSLLTQRSLMKKAIMSYPYGAGSLSRVRGFTEFFIDQAYNIGLNTYDYKAIISLSSFLDRLFIQFKNAKLNVCEGYLSIGQLIIDVDKEDNIAPDKFGDPKDDPNIPFIMDIGDYATTSYVIHQSRERRIVVDAEVRGRGTHKIKLYNTMDYISAGLMQTALHAIFVHTNDSQLLRLIKEIVAEINLRLAPYKISKTTYENQDNFAINSEYAIVFEAILTEGYRRFYKSGFLLQYFNHIPDLKAKEREKIPNKINAKNPVL